MPELPEVETIRRGLSTRITNHKILAVDILWEKSFADFEENESKIIGAKITGIDRTGKLLVLNLSSGTSLVFHLKMTGQVVFQPNDESEQGFGGGHPSESLNSSLPDKSTRVIIKLNSGNLFFNDQRKFGWIKIVKTGDHQTLIKNMGPDVLDLNQEQFLKLIKLKPKSKLKALLLDQSFVAGIGNIYADEALNAAHLHPDSRVEDLTGEQLKNLYEHIKNILSSSIKLGGSSSKNYVDSSGRKGKYLDGARVYGREDRGCKDCGSKIIKLKVAGRGTHICENCQKRTE
jgi:formamidopyrimidine-DNA glycosylase